MAENIEIPPDTDKILFVEDLIKFTTNVEVQYPNFRAGLHRERVHNAFNETMECAVLFLEQSMEFEHEDMCNRLANASALSTKTFVELGRNLKQKYFPEGFDPEKFLHFCVRITTLSAFFYDHGITEAPMIAFILINVVLREYDVGGWDTLNRIAERYVTIQQNTVNLESANCLSSDEETPEYATDQNSPQNADLNNENGILNKLTTEKQNDLNSNVEKIEKSQKHNIREEELSSVSKKFCKYNPENGDISSSSQVSQSTSNMAAAEMINEPRFANELELQDTIDMSTSKNNDSVQHSSFIPKEYKSEQAK